MDPYHRINQLAREIVAETELVHPDLAAVEEWASQIAELAADLVDDMGDEEGDEDEEEYEYGGQYYR